MSPTSILVVCIIVVSASTLAWPELSPARFLFGIRVGDRIRKTEHGRQALRLYYTHDVTGILLTIAIAFAMGTSHTAVWYFCAVLPQLFAGIGYIRAGRHLRPFATGPDIPAIREADLSLEPDRLPRLTLLGLPPFLFPIAGALWVRAHWHEIPARIAVHFGIGGQPNGWTTRSPLHLYGWFIFITGVLILQFAMSIIGFYGARRSAARQTMLAMMISVMYPMSIVFSGIGIWVAHHFPVWILFSILPPVIVAMILWNRRRARETQPSADTTPDEYWSMTDVYNNPNDPALFVPKRWGYGYTINFGNPAGKWVCGGFIAGMGLMVAFLLRMIR